MPKSTKTKSQILLKTSLVLSMLTSGQTYAETASRSAAEPDIAEGRTALKFYPIANTETDDKARLANNTPAYPSIRSERLSPLLELGSPFLGLGPIPRGIETPTGQMLQPWFLLYGSVRSALQSYDNGHSNTVEWANRIDVNGNLNLSGTERVLFSLRPIDGQDGSYSGYNFQPKLNQGWQQDFNTRLNKLYFEGDLGEIFPNLDPSDSHSYDVGFSVGRQQLSAQDGILLNDNLDALGITRNSLMLPGISNLRLTGLYGWNNLNRGNNENRYQINNHSVNLFGLLAAADTAWDNSLELDVLHIGAEGLENAWYAGAGSTQRFGTLNTTFRVNASLPEHAQTLNSGRGVLLVSQLARAISGSDNNLYLNSFLNLGRFTSAGRGADQGSPLANFGILYNPVGMGRYGTPLGISLDNIVGAILGYQLFINGVNQQLIFEAGGSTQTSAQANSGILGFGVRYQQALGKRHLFRLDSFVAGKDSTETNYGIRTEWMIKF